MAIKGLLAQKIAEGDRETALKLAEKAFALTSTRKRDILLKLKRNNKIGKARVARWRPKQRRSAICPRMCSAAGYRGAGAARGARGDGGGQHRTREAAIAANKLSPDLVPRRRHGRAQPRAGGRCQGRGAGAEKGMEEAQPHPDLAAAFAEIVPEEHHPAQRLQRFKLLIDATSVVTSTSAIGFVVIPEVIEKSFAAATESIFSILSPKLSR